MVESDTDDRVDDALLQEAFIEGFKQSAEGFNWEFHNPPPEYDGVEEYLTDLFADWLDGRVVEFTCIDCETHIRRKRNQMDIDGLSPKRCVQCTFDRMAEP